MPKNPRALVKITDNDIDKIVPAMVQTYQAEIDQLRAENAQMREAIVSLVEAAKWVTSLWDAPMPYDAATTRTVFRQRLAEMQAMLIEKSE